MTAALLSVLAPVAGLGAATDCEPKGSLRLQDTEIVSAHFYDEGTVKDAGRPFPPTSVPRHCRVSGVVRPVPNSEIGFQVWLPQENWNGRLIGVGNGGYGGRILLQGGLAEAVKRGYAAVSTDTGHSGSAIDTHWAYQEKEKIIDWGHRAVHLMTVKAKEIVQIHYGRPVEKSYFISCSNGGRQGLMEAQRYPNDYDGILVGAPAIDFTGLVAAFAWNYLAQNGSSESVIPPAFASHISKTVNEQCDHLDGVRDGLISDPRTCRVDFAEFLCGEEQSGDCLSKSQLEALLKIYGGPKNGSGQQIHPGWPVGGEAGTSPVSGWEIWTLGTRPHQRSYVDGFFQHLLGRGSGWSVRHMDFDHDTLEAKRELGSLIDATNPDLRAFAEKGGKLIIYHGWSDEAVPAGGSIRYFEDLQRFMGAEKVEQFARLYLVPGMHHCFGGHGPSLFNHLTAPISPADPSRDIAAALATWVEHDAAPGALIAVEPENLFEATFDLSLTIPRRTGLLCPYPRKALLRGKALDPMLASSYYCSD